MQDLSNLEKLPRTTNETSQLIEQHEELVKRAFDDPRLVVLQQDGENTMSSLRRNEYMSAHSDDYKYALILLFRTISVAHAYLLDHKLHHVGKST